MRLAASNDWSANERGLEEASNTRFQVDVCRAYGLTYQGLGEARHSSALEASRGYFRALFPSRFLFSRHLRIYILIAVLLSGGFPQRVLSPHSPNSSVPTLRGIIPRCLFPLFLRHLGIRLTAPSLPCGEISPRVRYLFPFPKRTPS